MDSGYYIPWGKPGEVLKLDVDPLSHPAWTGGGTQLRENLDRLQGLRKSLEILKFSTNFFNSALILSNFTFSHMFFLLTKT